jgi:hypothetical protein
LIASLSGKRAVRVHEEHRSVFGHNARSISRVCAEFGAGGERTMSERRKPAVTRESGVEQDVRNQEVRRANRELAAYFKGQRTEREARAALKIIKAFVRDRERSDPKNRPPLPGLDGAKKSKAAARHAASGSRPRAPRQPRAAKSIAAVPSAPSDPSTSE